MEISNYQNSAGPVTTAHVSQTASAEGQAAQRPSQPTGAAESGATETAGANQDALKSALASAGLKPTEENLKIVMSLIENEMPVSKENMLALSKAANFAGQENLKKAIVLLKNDIPATLASMEKFDSYVSGGQKLASQIENLAESIMKMEPGAQKQRLLAIFSGGKAAEASENAGATKSALNPQLEQEQKIVGQSTGQVTEQTGKSTRVTQEGAGRDPNAAVTGRQAGGQEPVAGQTGAQLSPKEAASNSGRIEPAPSDAPHPSSKTAETPPDKANTGTALFREVFKNTGDAATHLKQYPLADNEREFINRNADKLNEGLKELTLNGELKKDDLLKLVKAMPDSEKIMEALKDADKIKSFILSISELNGTIKDNIERTKGFNREIAKGAKRIAEKMGASVSAESAELDDVQENLKGKLSQIAKALESGSESDAVRRNVEEIKENLSFLSRFKNDMIVNLPIMMNDRQNQAELYVFADKKSKNKSKHSQSALVSLDLANLGLFETYLQKTGNAVTCQFRLKDEKIEKLVRENIEKLEAGLKEKGYALNSFGFVQIGEKFDLADGEQSLSKEHMSVGSGFSVDLRM